MNRVVNVALLLALLGPPLLAQSPDGAGRAPLGSYASAGIDTINVLNGNLMLNLDLIKLPGRELSTGVSLVYNAQGWRQAPAEWGGYSYYDGGWRMGTAVPDAPFVAGWEETECAYYPLSGTGWWIGGYTVYFQWTDATGALHLYPQEIYGIDEFSTEWCTYEAIFTHWLSNLSGPILVPSTNSSDPTRLRLSPDSTWNIAMQDGTLLYKFVNNEPLTLISPNGNFLEFEDEGGMWSRLPFQDTLGRTIEYDAEDTQDGWSAEYTVKDAGGTSRTYRLNFGIKSAYNPIAWPRGARD